MALELGRYLVDQSAGTQAVCLMSPHDDGNATLEKGLTEGLAGQIPVTFSVLQRDASDDLDVVGMTAPKVAAILDQHPETDLLIAMADLPYRGNRLAALLKQQEARLVGTRVLTPAILAPYSRAGVLACAVVYQENPANISDVRDGTTQEIFASQFVMVPGRTR
jgi:hypothetical protein